LQSIALNLQFAGVHPLVVWAAFRAAMSAAWNPQIAPVVVRQGLGKVRSRPVYGDLFGEVALGCKGLVKFFV
jgi:hypothetical protein